MPCVLGRIRTDGAIGAPDGVIEHFDWRRSSSTIDVFDRSLRMVLSSVLVNQCLRLLSSMVAFEYSRRLVSFRVLSSIGVFERSP